MIFLLTHSAFKSKADIDSWQPFFLHFCEGLFQNFQDLLTEDGEESVMVWPWENALNLNTYTTFFFYNSHKVNSVSTRSIEKLDIVPVDGIVEIQLKTWIFRQESSKTREESWRQILGAEDEVEWGSRLEGIGGVWNSIGNGR